jgi:hypothetical protein
MANPEKDGAPSNSADRRPRLRQARELKELQNPKENTKASSARISDQPLLALAAPAKI